MKELREVWIMAVELLMPPIILIVSVLLLPMTCIVFVPVKITALFSAAWEPFRRMIV